MKYYFRTIVLLLLSLGLFWCCEDKNTGYDSKTEKNTKVWADTIIYEVLIINPDTLNEWENNKVKYIRQGKMITDLFEMVYSGRKKAYKYYTNEAMSIKEVKELENTETFSRNKVGKLQFTETWKYNESTHAIIKDVHSILLAYEIYNTDNNVRGYKAAFYLKDF